MDELETVRSGAGFSRNGDGLVAGKEGPQLFGIFEHDAQPRTANQRGYVAAVPEA